MLLLIVINIIAQDPELSVKKPFLLRTVSRNFFSASAHPEKIASLGLLGKFTSLNI